jgi:hypothetical protein
MKIAQVFSHVWELGWCRRAGEGLLAFQKDCELLAPLGEATQNLLASTFLACFSAKAEFFEHQLCGRLGLVPQFRVAIQVFFGKGSFTLAPALDEVCNQTLH